MFSENVMRQVSQYPTKQDDVSQDVWAHLMSLKTRVDLFENYEPTNLPYTGARENPFGGLMYPGDRFYDSGSIHD